MMGNDVLDYLQYMVFVVLLLMLEAAITVDVFVNHDWEKVLFYI